MLNYIDDLGGGAPSKGEVGDHFGSLHGTLNHLRLVEAKHEASPPSQVMTLSGLQFDTVNVTITIPHAKLIEIISLVTEWQQCSYQTFTH